MTTWRETLVDGTAIPACPLALRDDASWSERHQAALLKYYLASQAGGVAVGVHTTQFAIRNPEHNLFEPVLRLTRDVLDQLSGDSFIRVAGICGQTPQATAEARLANDLGYNAGLLNLGAMKTATDAVRLEHCRAVASEIPVFGFYLHPAVGGCLLSFDFWRRFCEIDNVVAIKIAAFNRYQTWDVVRAVIESGRDDIALYTGNDDNIINDLLTPFHHQGKTQQIVGGLLGQWAVWTQAAVKMLKQIKIDRQQSNIAIDWLTQNMALTDANGVIFDATNDFRGCIPGINELLRRQRLVPSTRCLDSQEVLSPGQQDELTRITDAYPQLTDTEFVAQHVDEWLS